MAVSCSSARGVLWLERGTQGHPWRGTAQVDMQRRTVDLLLGPEAEVPRGAAPVREGGVVLGQITHVSGAITGSLHTPGCDTCIGAPAAG